MTALDRIRIDYEEVKATLDLGVTIRILIAQLEREGGYARCTTVRVGKPFALRAEDMSKLYEVQVREIHT